MRTRALSKTERGFGEWRKESQEVAKLGKNGSRQSSFVWGRFRSELLKWGPQSGTAFPSVTVIAVWKAETSERGLRVVFV